MKKIRIELGLDSIGKTLTFFDSAESLYLWTQMGRPTEPEGSFDINLNPGDYIEIEWYGCEYVYDGPNSWQRLNCLRMAKAMRTKNASGVLVTVHYGWASDDTLPFASSQDDVSRTILVNSQEESMLDLPLLFKDEGSEDSEEPTDENSGSDEEE